MKNREKTPRLTGRQKATALVLVVALGLAAVLVFVNPPAFLRSIPSGIGSGFGFSITAAEQLIRSWGPWGMVASIGLMILHSFIPFPSEVLAIANGMIYGPVIGSLLTWTGAMLGAFLAFGLARFLGKPFVRTVLPSEKWDRIDAWSHQNGGSALLVSRLVPMIAFNLINYAAGLTSISWWTFSWATALGILPLTVLLAIFGHNMTIIPWWVWPLFGLAAIGAWMLLTKFGAGAEQKVDEKSQI